MGYGDRVPVSVLIGKTLSRAEKVGNDEIQFDTTDGKSYRMYHDQSCCESVAVEDITGDLDFLVGSPILMADESSNSEWPESVPQQEYPPESFTWTFYKFGTMKGYVDIRWLGESNGYYSESVDFVETR